MPWQRYVADTALEIDPASGRLKYRTVVITVPRQSGKTTLLLSLMVHRAIAFGERQSIVYTAQTQKAARKKWEEEHVELLNRSPFHGKYRVRYTIGSEQIHWKNGSRHSLTAPTEKAGHGETIDCAVLDEAFAQEDNRIEQALRPAMITRQQPQMYIISTAGTARSVYLKGKVEKGRQLVTHGLDTSLAYFEWSAPDDADPSSEETWRACMPALGHTINIDAIRDEFTSMQLPEFRRAYLNQWSDEIPELWLVITEQDWDLCKDYESQIPNDESLAFGLDFTPERSFGTIAVAGKNADERLHLEITSDETRGVVDHRPGTSWMVPRMVELARKWKPCAIVIQANSPAASLIPELKSRLPSFNIVSPSSAEYAGACGAFYDGVFSGKIAHLGQAPLAVALAGAMKLDLGEGAWKWNRKMVSVDISPLIAFTLASWGHTAFSHVKTASPWVGWI